MKRTNGRYMNERGFSLVEIMVSMSLLSIVLVTLAAWTFSVARRSVNSSAVVRRTAEMTKVVGRWSVLPFDSLPAKSGCTSVTSATFPHQRCVTVTDVSSKVRRVRVVITPTNSAYRPDTVVVDRTRPTSANPFNT